MLINGYIMLYSLLVLVKRLSIKFLKCDVIFNN